MLRFILFVFLVSVIVGCTSSENNSEKKSLSKNILVTAEGKKEMILLTERPANLETPLKYFLFDFTPNEEFFVRWHLPTPPHKISADAFRLKISGHVKKETSLSLKDLRTKFTPFSINALALCAGNSRSFFDPRVAGAQWKNGAMGNARWTGVKLKDVLEYAAVKSGAFDVSLNGMDEPPMSGVPDFQKSLRIEHAMDGEVMIAYEMNGDELPLLNGYPLKLVVPGWYATYWVGMLNEIKIHPDTFKNFWMQKAYLIPKDVSNGNENPDSLGKNLVPINKIDVRSVFVSPEPNEIIKCGNVYHIQGVAFDCGDGITKVEISVDSGKTWLLTNLDFDLGKYSWRRWRYDWKPASVGTYHLFVKATNASGETQPNHQWNRSGYMRNEIETIPIKVDE